MESKLARILEAVAYLKGKRIIRTQKDVAEAMGYNKSTISMALKGDDRYFTDSFIEKFSNTFNVDKNWIETGTGSLDNTNNQFNPKTIVLDSSLLESKDQLHALALFVERNRILLRKDFVWDMLFKDVEDKAEIALMKKLREEIDMKTDISIEEIKKRLLSKMK
ncbi:MAG: helix-turn-helix domain-containing protein [Bacteroidota bacterium]